MPSKTSEMRAKRLVAAIGGRRRLMTFLGSLVVLASLVFAQQQPPSLPDPTKPLPADLPAGQPGQLAPKPATPAAEEGDTSGVKPTVFGVTNKTVLAPTTVIDRKSHSFVNGLAVANFQLLDNDKPQKISSDFIVSPISLVVVMQANSDIEPVLPKLKRTGILLHSLISGDTGEVAVLAFDHRVQLIQDFTHDPDKLEDAMEKIKAGSSSAALVDAVVEATHMLTRRTHNNANRRIILLISQDRDKGSSAKIQETVRGLEFNSIEIYAVDVGKVFSALMRKPQDGRPVAGGLPPTAMPNPRGDVTTGTDVEQNYDLGNYLNVAPQVWRSIRDIFMKTPEEAFTQYTGGTTYTFEARSRSLEEAISSIGREIHSQYILSYSPNDQTEPGFHTIKVSVDKPGLEIRTRPGYYWGGGQAP
jgi:VWFA-related protein